MRILSNREDTQAVLYCSTSGWAFGPLFESSFQAEAFLAWLPGDARTYTNKELSNKYSYFLSNAAKCKECYRWFVKTDSDPLRFQCEHCIELAGDEAENP